MSERETWIGSAKKYMDNFTESKAYLFLKYIENVSEGKIEEFYDEYQSFKDIVNYESPDYFVYKDSLYKLDIKVSGDPYTDISYMKKDKASGEYNFVYSFYNGGTSFEESLNRSFEELLKEE